ncbi:ATP-dependent carboxylate-amine ligase [Actinorugispora endophytica]|uniref:ATP-dependent carboxylate-amine ligase n=1 Tax=Actinorugispora endophytica TaxID=1605990 RepID=UPI00105DFCE6|nr:ATP-dependent carboxylate-amine ligase [Actinorugispora endophytica]
MWNWLDPSGAELGFGSVRAVWYRRPGWPHLDRADPVPGGGADRPHDWGMLLAALWERLDAFWLPAPPHVLRRIAKPLQLLRARDLGLDIPDTLVSTDPDAVLAFYERHNGNVVSKRIGHLRPALSDDGFRYAEPFTRRDLRHAEAVRAAPVIFQEYVAKRLELRVTVVGEAVFTAAIHSQAANRTRYDWRHYDTASTPHRPHRLPDDVAARCVELVRSFGLAFGTLDLVLTPEGRHVFLEVNPNGQYLWIEHLTGLPISAAVAGLLGAEARAASRRAAGG